MRRGRERQEAETPAKVEQEGKEHRRRRQETVGRRAAEQLGNGGDGGGRWRSLSHLGVEVAAQVDDLEPDPHPADGQVGAWHGQHVSLLRIGLDWKEVARLRESCLLN